MALYKKRQSNTYLRNELYSIRFNIKPRFYRPSLFNIDKLSRLITKHKRLEQLGLLDKHLRRDHIQQLWEQSEGWAVLNT